MNIELLKTFLTAAELKNFTKAAQRHHVVQSTVTARIKDLENELGVQLFVRDQKNVVLTEKGHRFLVYAKQIVDCESMAVKEMHSELVYQEQIRIGVSHSLYTCHLEKIIQTYLEYAKYVSMDIKVNDSVQTIWNLLDNVVDLSFSYTTFAGSQVQSYPFRTEKLLLVTSHKNQDGGRTINLEQMKKLPIVITNYTIKDAAPEWYLDLFNDYNRFSLRINSGQYLVNLLKNGIYYSLLPESMVEQELDSGALIEIEIEDVQMPLLQSFVLLKARSLENEAIRDFLKICGCIF